MRFPAAYIIIIIIIMMISIIIRCCTALMQDPLSKSSPENRVSARQGYRYAAPSTAACTASQSP
jgi:hypothetical protein